MNRNLTQIKTEIYDNCGFIISNLKIELESKEYDACQFNLSGRSLVSRSSKVTPKKVGQFVTFWKRNEKGSIEPFSARDVIDYLIVNVRSENNFGQFVFPKSILIKKKIISTDQIEGKRAFRVYPIWDQVQSKQADRTQKWQLVYFYSIDDSMVFQKAKRLYNAKAV